MNVEKFVDQWTCNMSQTCSFETSEETQAHKIQCKLYHNARQEREVKQQRFLRSEAANMLNGLARFPPKRDKEENNTGSSNLPSTRYSAIKLVTW